MHSCARGDKVTHGLLCLVAREYVTMKASET